MKKNFPTQEEKLERRPITHHSNFLSPWFEDFFGRELSSYDDPSHFMTLPIDIEETADEYVACINLPGIKKEDIRVECTENELVITAEKHSMNPQTSIQNLSEKYYSNYRRSCNLPPGVDIEKIEALFDDNVLIVNLPKKTSNAALD